MDFVFAADVDTAKTDKTSFPDFPGENPPQAEMLKWLDAWHDDLVTSGFSAHLRVSSRPAQPALARCFALFEAA